MSDQPVAPPESEGPEFTRPSGFLDFLRQLGHVARTIGRALVNRGNAEPLAIWVASAAYSLILVYTHLGGSSGDPPPVWIPLLAAVPFAIFLHVARVGLNRVWADHLLGKWVYVSYPRGFPDHVATEDIGPLGQPRLGLAEFTVQADGAVRMTVDLFRDLRSVQLALDKAISPDPTGRIGVLTAEAADYNSDQHTLFIAYRVEYHDSEPARVGRLRVYTSPVSGDSVLTGTWISWDPREPKLTRAGRMEFYKPTAFRQISADPDVIWKKRLEHDQDGRDVILGG